MQNFGYLPHPTETEAFVASIPSRIVRAVDALKAHARTGEDVRLWEPLRIVLRQPAGWRLPARNQGNKGSCVGCSDAGLQDLLAAADIVERRDPERWVAPHSAIAAYIAGRQIAGMLGGPDGSYGGAMARAVREIGTLVEGKYGSVDLSQYSISVIEQLDRRGGGMTPEMKAAAADHTIHETALIETLAQLDAVLFQYFPVNVCSNFGSNDRARNQDGCLRWNTRWAHSMHVCGIIHRGGKKIYVIRNSWGSEWMTAGPLVCDDMPMGAFGVYQDDMQRILDERDSFARAGYHGFRKREIDLNNVFNF